MKHIKDNEFVIYEKEINWMVQHTDESMVSICENTQNQIPIYYWYGVKRSGKINQYIYSFTTDPIGYVTELSLVELIKDIGKNELAIAGKINFHDRQDIKEYLLKHPLGNELKFELTQTYAEKAPTLKFGVFIPYEFISN